MKLIGKVVGSKGGARLIVDGNNAGSTEVAEGQDFELDGSTFEVRELGLVDGGATEGTSASGGGEQ